jgi:hypothetical protein
MLPYTTYFNKDKFQKPLAQNLVCPDLCSFTPQYGVSVFLFDTYRANPLFIVALNPL